MGSRLLEVDDCRPSLLSGAGLPGVTSCCDEVGMLLALFRSLLVDDLAEAAFEASDAGSTGYS